MGNTVQLDIIAIDSASSILEKIGGEFGALGEIGVAALGAISGVLGTLIEAGKEEQDTMTRFNALVDSSPLKGYKDTMEQMATTWSQSTRFQKDNILAAEGQLSIYTNIGQKVFPDALKATLNLATYMKTDATTAATSLGKALEDISGGSLSLLARTRLLTKEQKDTAIAMENSSGDAASYKYEIDNASEAVRLHVEELQKLGKHAEASQVLWEGLGTKQQAVAEKIRTTNGDAKAQAYVIGILNGKIGELSTEMGANFPGQMDIFNNKIQEFTDEQGSKFLDVLEPVIANLSSLADEVLPVLADVFDQRVLPAIDEMVTMFDRLMNGTMTPAAFFQQMHQSLSNIDWKGISEGLAKSIEAIDWNKLGENFTTGGNVLAQAIKDFFGKTDWGAMFVAIDGAFMSFIGGTMGIDWNKSWKTLADNWKLLMGVLPGYMDVLMADVKKRFDSWWQQILAEIQAIPNTIANALKDPFKGAGIGSPGSSSGSSSGTKTRTGATPRASGGDVYAGQMYLVGEQGPELFKPNGSGNIVPNSQLTGANGVNDKVLQNNGTINIYWSGTNAGSVSRLMADLGAAM